MNILELNLEFLKFQGFKDKSVGNHKTSMLQDVENGKEFELDAFLGSVIELAANAESQCHI